LVSGAPAEFEQEPGAGRCGERIVPNLVLDPPVRYVGRDQVMGGEREDRGVGG